MPSARINLNTEYDKKIGKKDISAPRIELGTFRLQILQLQSNVINQLHQAEDATAEAVLGILLDLMDGC
jgi:hypothetical protein